MSGFDRIKPPERRLLERPAPRQPDSPEADAEGRAALFSAGGRATPGLVLFAVECERCGAVSPLGPGAALRSALPLFLVAPWRRHPVFASCPACRRRSWLRPRAPA